MTNCINCGAPLSGYICDYCGTDFGFPEHKAKVAKLECELIKAKTSYMHTLVSIQQMTEECISAMRNYGRY